MPESDERGTGTRHRSGSKEVGGLSLVVFEDGGWVAPENVIDLLELGTNLELLKESTSEVPHGKPWALDFLKRIGFCASYGI